MPDPRPDDRRRRLEADVTPVDTDTDGDGVSDRDESAAGSDPHDRGDVPIDLGSLPDTPRDESVAPTEPVVPNKEFWEQHYAREVQGDGSVIVTPRNSYDAPAAYTGRVADMQRDSDGDGLTDWQEYEQRTDPKNPDTDGDGRSDGDESAEGFDPTSPTPPNATLTDQDGDGLSDSDEVHFGGGGGFTIDTYAAAGLGTDGTQIKDKYYAAHKTGDACRRRVAQADARTGADARRVGQSRDCHRRRPVRHQPRSAGHGRRGPSLTPTAVMSIRRISRLPMLS